MNRRTFFIKTVLLLFLMASGLSDIFGQSRKYSTQVVLENLKKEFPDFVKEQENIESTITEYSYKNAVENNVINIPLVFHVLAKKDGSVPGKEQIAKQIEILNQAFGVFTPEDKDVPNEEVKRYLESGGNPGIQFYLGSSELVSSGIKIVNTDRDVWGIKNEIQDSKAGGSAPETPEKFINIWIAELGDSNAGFAYMPGSPKHLDGIIIDPDYLWAETREDKSPYSQGKTLVHLMGTYLGLYELWNETTPCEDDKVFDTPLHDYPSDVVSTEKNHRQICFCLGSPVAMYMNFMDNTRDHQLSLFTKGQITRMRAVLSQEGPRGKLNNDIKNQIRK